MAFAAQYRGTCVECLDEITVGEQITTTVRYGASGYAHVTCPDTPDERPTRFQGTSLYEMGF